MSFKSLIQVLVIILILFIIGGVYYKYFNTTNVVVEEINQIEKKQMNQINELEKKILDLELKNEKLNNKIDNKRNESDEIRLQNLEKTISEQSQINDENKLTDITEKNNNNETEKKANNVNTEVKKKKETIIKKNKIKNLVKDVEYTSVDQKGNRFYLLANSGKSNINNNDILDLDNVRGKITSDTRDTIYIVSDYAKYNSVNLNSKFYENVIINYQDKEITCVNFDINMETNKAIAYNDVVVTDPKSVMKAGIVEFDLKTKNININPESSTQEIEVVTN